MLLIYIYAVLNVCLCETKEGRSQDEIFTWNQIGYNLAGVLYYNSTSQEHSGTKLALDLLAEAEDTKHFFIQPYNMPMGLAVYKNKVFISVPRRKHGIPSTLNYVILPRIRRNSKPASPLLKPYPDWESSRRLVSVYRPRVDACGRLWIVDTGLEDVPGARKHIQPPSIVIYDLKTDKEILKHELDPSTLVNERTSGGLTSITVDVDPKACGDAYAYINDLTTEGLIVFSLKTKDSWRLDHHTFKHDEQASNFMSTGHILNWTDGIFSIALSGADEEGKRTAYYHPMVSTKEFSIDTAILKNKTASLEGNVKLVGNRGPNSQSSSHDFHQPSGVLFFAYLAQDGIACWKQGTPIYPDNVPVIEKDTKRLGYISNLIVVGDYVYVLANGMPKFVYNTQNIEETNYYIRRYLVKELIKGTVCDSRMKHLNNF